MALLHLKSTNPNFSYVILKNPETGLIAKTLKRGTLFGFFSANDTYTAYFKDASNQVSYPSYKDESFDYMNVSRYSTPLFPLDVISEFFKSTFKCDHKDVLEYDKPGYSNMIELNLVRLDTLKYIDIFTKYLPEFEVTLAEISNQNYKLFIKTQRPIVDLVNYTALFMVFNILKNAKDYIEMNPDQTVKYLSCLGRLEVPYFMKYVFKVNLVRSPKVFKQYKDVLDTSINEKIDMVHGSTSDQRLQLIQNKLTYQYPICEIGCSTGKQTSSIAKRSQKTGIMVYAIDPDPDCRAAVTKQMAIREYTGVEVLDSFTTFEAIATNDKSPFEVLMIEVIEHMEIPEATALLKDVVDFCSKRPGSKLVLTTPNFEFNQFYAITGYRHDDHKFEFTEEMFLKWVHETTVDLHPAMMTTFTVGDKVNEIGTTLGLEIVFGGDANETHN
jgi:2-polyprenyl-3-methyl-5-hydroxy-6-metoxy-1,4-benzoquinol methylase